MRISIVPMALGVLAAGMPCLAQETPKGPPEKLPPPAEATAQPMPAEKGPACGPACAAPCEAPPRFDYKVLWMPNATPVQTIVGREVVVPQEVDTLEVVVKEEARKITEFVVKSREVERAIPCETMVECEEKDPQTGKACKVMKPVTTYKTIKDVEYYSEPVERTVMVPVASFKPAKEIIPRLHTIFEYQTSLVPGETPVLLPPREVLPNRNVLAPQPPPPVSETPVPACEPPAASCPAPAQPEKATTPERLPPPEEAPSRGEQAR